MARTKALVKQMLKNTNIATRKSKPNTGGIKIKYLNKKPKAGAFKLFKKASNFIRIRIESWIKNSQTINNLIIRKIHFEEKYKEVLRKITKIDNQIIKLSNKVEFWRFGKEFLINKLKKLNKAIFNEQSKLHNKIKNI